MSETNSVETNQVERIVMLPCPFCGSTNLTPGYWSLDDGEVDSVECDDCYAGAPVDAWNKRNEDT